MPEAKNIILLSDGTGNSDASPHKTNVWRLYKAIDTSAQTNQLVFYDNGVGTSNFTPAKVLGLALGFGLRKNVKELYSDLCRVYQPGDKIYIFGFSRGAFTARVLAALIGEQGIINDFENESELRGEVKNAFVRFRRKAFKPSILEWVWHLFPPYLDEKKDDTPMSAPIEFIGVWDTVDAYGAPIDELTNAWDTIVYRLTAKDRNLSKHVVKAYQALALDESREAFEPMLWNERESKNSDEETRITQVWFSGVHASVGGGYPDDSVAYVSLNWMINGAKGLIFHKEMLAEYKRAEDPFGPIPDNRTGFGNIYRYAPRNLEMLNNDTSSNDGKSEGFFDGVVVELPKIHYTVFDRIRNGGDGYAPINLPEHYQVVDNNGPLTKQSIKHLGAALPLPVETKEQAFNRRTLQANIWINIWQRKLLHLATLGGIIVFIFYPYLYPVFFAPIFGEHRIASIADPLFGGFADIVRTVPTYIGKIPGLAFLESWANDYKKHPYILLICVATIWGMLSLSTSLKYKIRDRMRIYWRHITHGDGKNTANASIKQSRLVHYFNSNVVKNKNQNELCLSLIDKISRGAKKAVEKLATIFLGLIILLIISRVIFTIVDGFGGICKIDSKATQTMTMAGVNVQFKPKQFCYDTGVELTAGQKYQVTFKVTKWSDKTIAADVHGWVDEAPFFAYLATPLLRHYSVDWYQPVARVGNTFFKRHIDTQERKVANVAETSKSYIFEASYGGRLFLYMNDAVLSFLPFSYDHFYKNNNGTASLKIIPFDN